MQTFRQSAPGPLRFNVFLLGKIGVGKSSSGNTLLRRKAFITKKSFARVTKEVQKETVSLDGVTLDVYDTPGYKNNPDTYSHDVRGTLQSVSQTFPSVILLVMKFDRFTPEEKETVELIEQMLPDRLLQNTWILFTGGDELERENLSMEELIEETDELNRVVLRFQNRYHIFNNFSKREDQVKKLIKTITEASLTIQVTSISTRMQTPGQSALGSLRFNVFLLGKTGVGKSSSGNTLLGQNVFIAKKSSSNVTKKVQKGTVILDGVTLDVYDTPGHTNPDTHSDDVRGTLELFSQIDRTVPSVILLVMKFDRFTPEEKETVELLEQMLPDWLLQNTWILFTGGDELERQNLTIEEFVEETDELKKLVLRFQKRYHIFNNFSQRPDQVKKLIKIISEAPLTFASELSQTVPTDPENDPSSIRIVLLGKTGVGKSAAGNTILGEKRFTSEFSFSSITTQCEMQQADVAGTTVCVVDTPGLFDTNLSPEEYAVEIGNSIYLSSPGPHAFLYVLPINTRFTDQEVDAVQKCELIFGKGMKKYTVILFTHGDLLKDKSVDEMINGNRALSRLVNECGGRYHVFNNEDLSNRDQVNKMMKKIEDRMVEHSGGRCYTNEMYEDAARFRKMEEQRVRKEEEDRKKREEEEKQKEITKIKKAEETKFTAKLKNEMAKINEREQREVQKQEEERKQIEKEKKELERVRRDTERKIREEMMAEFRKKHKHNLRISGSVAAGGGITIGCIIGAIVCGCVGGPIGATIGLSVGACVSFVGSGVGLLCTNIPEEHEHAQDAVVSDDHDESFSIDEGTSDHSPLLNDRGVKGRGNRKNKYV